MINKDTEYEVYSSNEKWVAKHPLRGLHGPLSISYKEDTLVSDCGGYVGKVSEKSSVKRRIKDFHKAGTSVLEAEGFMPAGNSQIDYKHIYRYSDTRLRVTSDIRFEGGSTVNRHFGLGSLFLPGKWQDFKVVPGPMHQAHDAKTVLREVPKYDGEPLMLAHLHRQPLSVTFRRPNGTAIELGTGFDIWRWDENLGYGPESGSVKVILEEDGIRFIREPLACCEEFTPEHRPFRFTWYMAWRENGANKNLPKHELHSLEFDTRGEVNTYPLIQALKKKKLYTYVEFDWAKLTWKNNQQRIPSNYDYIRGKEGNGQSCWCCSSVVTRAKKIIRKIAAVEGLDGIVFKNFVPGTCFNPAHVSKKHENGTAHWDLSGLFDLGTWAKNHCGDKLHLHVKADKDTAPSLAGLFE